VSPALYLIDTSGLFRILQDKLRQAWSEQLTAGVIAICPIVELEFLYSARSGDMVLQPWAGAGCLRSGL
jgi:predicted nucleic acid-binding protein